MASASARPSLRVRCGGSAAAAGVLLQRFPPRAVLAVPINGPGEAHSERNLRRVPHRGDLAVVDGVAQVVAAAPGIGDVVDIAPVASGRIEHQLRELAIGELLTAADVVEITGLTALGDEREGAAMVGDVEPVARVLPFPVQSDGATIEQVGDV